MLEPSSKAPVARATRRALLFFLMLAPAIATAREGGRAESRSDDPAAVKARALYDSGTAHYNLSEFREALSDYKQGYRIKPDPAFLFNIGQCHRQLGEPEEAAKAYRAYLRASPDARNRSEVEGFISDADAAALARAKEAARPPQGTQPPALGGPSPAATATTAVTTSAATEPPPSPSRKWVWVVVGVGAVVIAGAAVGLGVGLSRGGAPPDSTLGNAGALP